MEKGKKYLLIMGCFLLLYSVVGATRLSGNAEEQIPELPEAESIYHSDFSNQKGSWQDLVGKAEVAQNATGLMISNTKQGTNLESVTLNKDAPKRSSGDFETTFLYEDLSLIHI